MNKTGGMKTAALTANAAVAFSLCACGNGDRPRTSDQCPPLSRAVEARFEQMRGPLGCAPTTSLIPDPPDGCDGVTELLRTAKDEYADLDLRGDCSGSPPDLAPSLASYERDFAKEHPFVEHVVRRDGF